MVAPSKKLTVSFGAFACTLEGFDDPFPVMRQVVDYFQALASADPSFGAHPERPDTDYLKTLAQESAGGTVEAELSEDGMILRQSAGAEIAPTLDAVEDAPTQIDPDTLMQSALAEARFEDVDTLLEQSVKEPQFEDVREDEGFEADIHLEDHKHDQTAPVEDDVAGASLPDWAQDLIEDAIEHGEEAELATTDPIAQEEEALERVLRATEERAQTPPQLDRANPLAQLRAEENAQSEDIVAAFEESTQSEDIAAAFEEGTQSENIAAAFEENTQSEDIAAAFEESAQSEDIAAAFEVDDFDQLLSQEMAQLDDPIAEPTPVAEALAETTPQEAAPTSQDVHEMFRALADTPEEPQKAPISAAEILRQEVERQEAEQQAQLQQQEAPKPKTARVLTAAASTKANGKPMRLTFDGTEGESNLSQADQKLGRNVARQQPATEPAAEAPLVLTKAQVIEPRAAAPETPALILVPEDAASLEADVNLGRDLNTFAASVGADTLPELLEASAAYVTLVSGRSTFSRRDIMTLLDEMCEPDEFTQEARIKSFGRLLRGGSILRTEDGHFAISDRALNSYEAKAGVA